jgi:hypothetical protein
MGRDPISAAKVDCCLEVLGVPEPSGGLLHPLDDGVHREDVLRVVEM